MGENGSREQKSSVMGVWIRNRATGRYEILPKEKLLAERRGWGWGGGQQRRQRCGDSLGRKPRVGGGTQKMREEKTREKKHHDGKLAHW